MNKKSGLALIATSAIIAIVSFATPIVCAEEAITRTSGVAALNDLKKFYAVPNFKLGGAYAVGDEQSYEFGGEGGTTLEDLGREPLKTACITVGTPKKNEEGKIVNAVLISSYYSGDASFSYFFWFKGQKGNGFAKGAVVGPGELIDTNKYYVIFVDAVGLWGASKPSEGLGMKFPRYSCLDMVQANYRLLKDHLGVAKVKLATGVSMGAMQSYILAVLHPDFVEAIMPVGGCTAMEPVPAWLFQLMTAAMKSDPAWMETKGDYYNLPKEKHPNKGMMFGWSILGQSAFGFDFRNSQPWDKVREEVFYWKPEKNQGEKLKKKAEDYDVNDLLFRNRALDGYDINRYLPSIKARTLILHVKNDQWLPYAKAKKAAEKIPGAKIAAFESPLAHYAIFRAPNKLKEDVTAFFKEIGMKE